MAFCTSCGAKIEESSRFCTSCGAPAAAPPPPVVTTGSGAAAQPARIQAAPAAQTSGGGALKVILIVLVVLIGLGIVGGAAAGYFAWRVARAVRVEQRSGRTSVQTPFGSVVSNDAAEVAKQIGVDVYPGARVSKGGAAVNLPGMKVASARFETDDPVERVAEFYQRRFPRSKIDVNDGGNQTIVAESNQGMITIHIHAEGGATMIEMSRVTGGPGMGAATTE